MKVVIIPGLTLPEVPQKDLDVIGDMLGNNGELVVTAHKDAKAHVDGAEVILGLVTEELFHAAGPSLKWVQSISSGVDMFFYPAFVESDVVLTSEKGLVGEHLADHGFWLVADADKATRYRVAVWR